VRQRGVTVEVQPELGELHRDLGVQVELLDPVEEPQVLVGRGGRLRRRVDVLPEQRERGRKLFVREA